jgi:hypothetical protein
MSGNPIYAANLVDANTMRVLDDLGPAKGRTFSPVFNNPGTYSFRLPITSDAARLVSKRASGVILFHNGVAIWSGGVTRIAHSGVAGSTSVTATGWIEELDHRYVRKSEEQALTFPSPGTVGGLIGKALVDQANAQTDTDGATRPLRASFGIATDTQTRIRAYKQGDSYGASFKELSEVENGFDFDVDPLTRRIYIRPPDAYADLTSVQFGYGLPPHNLEDFDVEDGDPLANRVTAVGSNGVPIAVDDATAITAAGVMLEEWSSISDVNGDTVAAFANAELVYKRYGSTVYKLKPASFGDLPRPYSDFQWGDLGYLSIDCGAVQVRSHPVRIFAGQIDISDNGDEIISELQVALT